MSAPGRKRLGRSPSRNKGQSPAATSRENKIEDQEPPNTSLAPTVEAICSKGEEGSKLLNCYYNSVWSRTIAVVALSQLSRSPSSSCTSGRNFFALSLTHTLSLSFSFSFSLSLSFLSLFLSINFHSLYIRSVFLADNAISC